MHVCEVEIDPETGEVEIVKYSAVDDFGKLINQMIVIYYLTWLFELYVSEQK